MVVLVGLMACSGGGVQGRVVDGMTHQPIAGPYRLTAKATGEGVAMGCQILTTDVGPDGAFSLSGLCSGTGYSLSVDRDDLWLADATVPDGGFPGPHDLEAWRAPKAAGLYVMSQSGELTALKTAADLKSDRILGSEERIRYPWEMASTNVAVVAPGQHLVLVGRSTVEEMTITPVLQSMPRWFGRGMKPPATSKKLDETGWLLAEKEKYRMGPWWYLGTTFTDNITFERVSTTVDASKVVEKSSESRAVKYLAADALPKGRYAIMKDGDRRMYLVDFGGEAPPLPADPEPPVPVQ